MTEEPKTAPLFARIPLDLKSDIEDIALRRKRRGDREGVTLQQLTIEALRLFVAHEQQQSKADNASQPVGSDSLPYPLAGSPHDHGQQAQLERDQRTSGPEGAGQD